MKVGTRGHELLRQINDDGDAAIRPLLLANEAMYNLVLEGHIDIQVSLSDVGKKSLKTLDEEMVLATTKAAVDTMIAKCTIGVGFQCNSHEDRIFSKIKIPYYWDKQKKQYQYFGYDLTIREDTLAVLNKPDDFLLSRMSNLFVSKGGQYELRQNIRKALLEHKDFISKVLDLIQKRICKVRFKLQPKQILNDHWVLLLADQNAAVRSIAKQIHDRGGYGG